MRETDNLDTATLNYLRSEVTVIRSLRRKLHRVFRIELSNEEVAGYFPGSSYGRYFRRRFAPGHSAR